MKLAIVGSRSFEDYSLMLRVIKEINPDFILTGDEVGAEALASKIADELNIIKHVFNTDTVKHGGVISLIHTRTLIKEADKIVAFWDGESIETKKVIEMADRLNKECTVHIFKT